MTLMRRINQRGLGWLAGLAMLLGLAAMPAFANPKAYPYQVTTTVGMVNDIVAQVAGDKAKVSGLIGPGIDPHLYNPTRSDVAALLKADVIFYSGLMLEGKMADTLVRVGRKKPVYAVTELIEERFLLPIKDSPGHFDPHVWMDASAWSLCVQAVAKSLSEFDPDNSAYYQANADKLRKQIGDMHEYGKKVLATIPANSRVLITSHDAFQYFGRAYGLTVKGIQGISTESEAGLADLNNLIDYIVKNQVKAVFVESSVSPKNVRALIEGAKARGHELIIGGELFSDAMGPTGTYEGTYLGMIDHNFTLITRALGGQAPEQGLHGKLQKP